MTDAAIIEAIRTYRAQHGYSPSIADLQTALGVSSKSVMHYRLRGLVARNRIAMDPGVARSIRVIGDAR